MAEHDEEIQQEILEEDRPLQLAAAVGDGQPQQQEIQATNRANPNWKPQGYS